LPQLKALSKPKTEIDLNEIKNVYHGGAVVLDDPSVIEERFKVKNTIATNFR